MFGKQFIKSFSIRMVDVVFVAVSTIIITRIVVGLLGSGTYGFYSLSNDFVNYAQIISIALNSMATSFLMINFHRNEITEVNKYFNSILLSNFILMISLLIPLILLVLNLNAIINIPDNILVDVEILFATIFSNFLLSIVVSVFNVSTYIKNRMDINSFISIGSTLIRVITVVLMYYFFEPKIWYLGIASLAATIFSFIINFYFSKKLTPEIEIDIRKYFDLKCIPKLLSSGIWNSFTKIASVLLGGLDLFITNKFVGAMAMGIMSIAKTLPKYMLTTMNSISTIYTPKIAEYYAKSEYDLLITNINNSIKINSFFSSLAGAAIIFFGVNIYNLWVPGENAELISMISTISILGYIVVLPFESLWNIFTITNKVKISSVYLTLESILVITTVFVLLSICDNEILKMVIIAGVSSVFEIIRGLIFLPITSSLLLGLPKKTFYRPLFRVFIFMVTTSVFGYIINGLYMNPNIIQLFVMLFVFAFASLVAGVLILLTKSDRENAILLVRTTLKKK